MTNVAHATLTGADIHEPKGITTAALGTAYVANGSGSGSWSNIGTSTFTGMIADFVAPVVPNGWLELDGSIINTTTFAGLYAVMTITTTGTRTNTSPIITSIADTSKFKVGYFAFGTGIISGTTIVSIDSGSQITLSNNAGSSGTATFAISPWLLNNGTITLPDLTTAGRYRRSRTSTTKVGDVQASANLAHTHTASTTTGFESVNHQHAVSGTTSDQSNSHSHSYNDSSAAQANVTGGGNLTLNIANQGNNTGTASSGHTHTFSANSGVQSSPHTHTVSLTTASTGGTEARPVSLVVMTCVKT